MQDDAAEGVRILRGLITGAGTVSFGDSKNGVKLLSVKKLKNDKKKYTAFFLVTGKQKEQKFGAEGMTDYTIHKDIERRNRYIPRNSKDVDTRDQVQARSLSMYF